MHNQTSAYDSYQSYLDDLSEKEDRIKEQMKDDSEEALMKITDYMNLDLTYNKLKLLAKCLAKAAVYGFKEADELVDDIGLTNQHLYAISDNYRDYEREISDDYDTYPDDDKGYYEDCYGN